MFSCRNKKNILWIPPIICSYELGSPRCDCYGEMAVVESRLDAGKFDGTCIYLLFQDYLGETPCHKAARTGSMECISLLVSQGAKLE